MYGYITTAPVSNHLFQLLISGDLIYGMYDGSKVLGSLLPSYENYMSYLSSSGSKFFKYITKQYGYSLSF